MLAKSEIRTMIFSKLCELSILEKEQCSLNCFYNFKVFFDKLNVNQIKTMNIGCYYPQKNELNSLHIITFLLENNYKVTLPYITHDKKSMKFSSYVGETINGTYNIQESRIKNEINPEIILAPLVAFDRKGGRVGYGKGFFDKYLAINKPFCIGIAYSVQEVDIIPVTKEDYLLDAIITNQEVRIFNNKKYSQYLKN